MVDRYESPARAAAAAGLCSMLNTASVTPTAVEVNAFLDELLDAAIVAVRSESELQVAKLHGRLDAFEMRDSEPAQGEDAGPGSDEELCGILRRIGERHEAIEQRLDKIENFGLRYEGWHKALTKKFDEVQRLVERVAEGS